MKLAFLLVTTLCALAGCTDGFDDRPLSLAVLTDEILQPNCATAECHSAMKAQSTDVFDSVAAAQNSIASKLLIACLDTGLDPCGDGRNTYLYTVVNNKDIEGDQMPLDYPLSSKDQAYIARWIDAGAEGYVSPNASRN